MTRKVAVVGSGGFGTCLALLLATNGLDVHLWARNPEYAAAFAASRENTQYLPGVRLPLNVEVASDLSSVISGADVVVAAVPSQAMRETMRACSGAIEPDALVVNVAKGIEHDSYLRMSEVVEQELDNSVATLSGPNHAEEIARRMPAASVIASRKPDRLPELCRIFTTPWFKAYPRSDIVGVELGGVMKNTTAIAAGVTRGIGFGDNSASAVITLGLDEMVRFGVAHGARKETFTGLSGLGDLIATATSPHSRNRRIGELLGRGLSLEDAMASMGGQVVEGVHATRFVHEQAQKEGVDLPLTREIYNILYEGKDVRAAVQDLLELL